MKGCIWVAVSAVALAMGKFALGADAVLIATPGSSGNLYLNLQGFAGRMSIQEPSVGLSSASLGTVGLATDGQTVWRLNGATPGNANAMTVTSFPRGGTAATTIQVPRSLADVAYTNGALYGIIDQASRVEIVRINADGSLTTIYNVAVTTPTTPIAGRWRLSGGVEGTQLAAYYAASSLGPVSPRTAYVVNAATGALTNSFTAQRTGSTSLSTGAVLDTVINRAGSQISFVSGMDQNNFNLPGGTLAGFLMANNPNKIGGTTSSPVTLVTGGVLSDEFNYVYSPDQDAIA